MLSETGEKKQIREGVGELLGTHILGLQLKGPEHRGIGIVFCFDSREKKSNYLMELLPHATK